MNMRIEEIIHRAGPLPASEIAGSVNDALAEHECVVITAPPGAGKSTLLPLTMMEGFCQPSGSGQEGGRVLMLEPRRLAARQIAERMADILGEKAGQTVGYRVRFDSRVSEATRVEVLTEGILTRRLIGDPALEGVSAVIFDEFHERSLNSDLALALTRQCQQILRPDLRIVIMSATIDTAGICASLRAPLIESGGRMHPVEVVHAAEDTCPSEVARAVAAAISRAHRQHDGDILAFLPGQGEIQQCAQLLDESLAPTSVCPLYGSLSPQQQRHAIAPSAAGERKVVLATPIAETSVTIEGVRIVIDSGYCRRQVFDARTGLSHLDTVRISHDMAVQRAGRAGRVSSGICYRLWTKATEHKMAEQRMPEISEADLAPMALSVAAFGENDVMSLPWLTPPPASAVARAQQLLRLLGAIDEASRITQTGMRMSQLPCHPRMSRMMIGTQMTHGGKGQEDSHKSRGVNESSAARLSSLACDVAAVLEEKDPMAESAGASTDLSLRVSLLRTARGRKSLGRWARVAQIAHEYVRMMRVAEDNADVLPEEIGQLVALAYPERVAKAVDDIGHYRLSSGGTVQLDKDDPLTSCPWIAIASLNVSEKSSRVFLAAPLRAGDMCTSLRDNVSWDPKSGSVVMRRERVVGVLVVESWPMHDVGRESVVSVICSAAERDGRSMFDWNESVARLQQRVQTVAQWHPELSLPDVSTDTLLSTAQSWLPFYLEQGGRVRTTAAELKKIDMAEVIWAQIPYEQQQEIDRLAPTHIQVPTGSRIRIDYRQGAAAPVLSVRLQECFGMEKTPCVNGGRQPVLMELLSPGYKPVQLTQDLSSFWQNAYFEVRKELRRRYPKHYWPENPLEAEAVRGVRRK